MDVKYTIYMEIMKRKTLSIKVVMFPHIYLSVRSSRREGDRVVKKGLEGDGESRYLSQLEVSLY